MPSEGSERPPEGASRKLSIRERRRRLIEEYESVAPPKPRRRLREARRWLDVLAVRCTNGRVCERRPGARHITVTEGAEIHARGLRDLEASDPELFRAVQRVMWENLVQDLDTTVEERKRDMARRYQRCAKVRAELQRAGSL